MVIFLFSLLILIVVLLDVPKLIKENRYRELAVYSFFMFIGAYLAMVQLFGWPFYNFTEEWVRMVNR